MNAAAIILVRPKAIKIELEVQQAEAIMYPSILFGSAIQTTGIAFAKTRCSLFVHSMTTTSLVGFHVVSWSFGANKKSNLRLVLYLCLLRDLATKWALSLSKISISSRLVLNHRDRARLLTQLIWFVNFSAAVEEKTIIIVKQTVIILLIWRYSILAFYVPTWYLLRIRYRRWREEFFCSLGTPSVPEGSVISEYLMQPSHN